MKVDLETVYALMLKEKWARTALAPPAEPSTLALPPRIAHTRSLQEGRIGGGTVPMIHLLEMVGVATIAVRE